MCSLFQNCKYFITMMYDGKGGILAYCKLYGNISRGKCVKCMDYKIRGLN